MKKLLAILLTAAMLITLFSCGKNEGGENEPGGQNEAPSPDEIAAKSDSYSFSLAEASYLFNKYYIEFYYNNSEYLSFYGLDKTKSLKEQTYSGDKTWFDFFAEQTKAYMNDILLFCEAAKNEGMELDDEDNKSIDDIIQTIMSQASGNGYTTEEMLHGMYGNMVELSVIRSFAEKEHLAYKYFNAKVDSYTFTEEQEDTYLKEHPDDFYYVNCISYTFKETSDKEAALHASELLSESSSEAFYSYVDKYETEVLKKEDSAKTGPTEINYSLKQDTDLMKWAFSAETQTSYLDSNEVDGVYTVYMLISAPALQEYNVRSMRYISLSTSKNGSYASALAKAKEVLEEWKAGEATAESFGELAIKYSDDTQNKNSGGIYLNAGKDDKNLPKAVIDWLFDESLTPGSTEILKGDSRYLIVYYESEGKTHWRFKADLAMGDAAYEKDVAAMKEKYKITVSDEVINKISE